MRRKNPVNSLRTIIALIAGFIILVIISFSVFQGYMWWGSLAPALLEVKGHAISSSSAEKIYDVVNSIVHSFFGLMALSVGLNIGLLAAWFRLMSLHGPGRPPPRE